MKRVLIVDDDTSFLKVLRYSLRGEKLDISCCSSGESALDLLNRKSFDLIISDLKMGPVSGLTIARSAHNRKYPIPVILLTAFAEEFMNNAWEKLPDRILSKPVELGRLAETIRELCDRQPANDTGIAESDESLSHRIIE